MQRVHHQLVLFPCNNDLISTIFSLPHSNRLSFLESLFSYSIESVCIDSRRFVVPCRPHSSHRLSCIRRGTFLLASHRATLPCRSRDSMRLPNKLLATRRESERSTLRRIQQRMKRSRLYIVYQCFNLEAL